MRTGECQFCFVTNASVLRSSATCPCTLDMLCEVILSSVRTVIARHRTAVLRSVCLKPDLES